MSRRRYTTDEILRMKFHYLTPLKEIHKEDGYIYWLCQCVCGKQVERRERTLIDHQHRVQSCGCQNPMKHRKAENFIQWTGCGEISGQYFTSLKHGAKNRDIEFNITQEYVWDLFIKQERSCALTKLPLCFSGLRARRKGIEQTASLDRIDSTKGYTIDNVQWIHKDVNRMKNGYSQDRFIEVCKLVCANL